MFKLAPIRHTGRVVEHHHTSYAALLFLVLLAGVGLLTYTGSSLATGPQSGQITLTGIVPSGAAPAAPSITSPDSGQRFTANPIAVEGTCTKDLLVRVYKNGQLSGSAICDNNFNFNIQIDLFTGRNDLTARQFSGATSSPDSNLVDVYLDEAATPTPGPKQDDPAVKPKISQLILKSDYTDFSTGPGQALNWPLELLGGRAPYAIAIDFGDGAQHLLSRSAEGTFNFTHTYLKPGNYRITVKATDADGRKAQLSLLALISGGVGTPAASVNYLDGGFLLVLWPLYTLLIAMLVSFWLGERYELYKVRRQTKLAGL